MTFEPSQCQAVALDLPKPSHPLVRLRLLISLWGVIREQVRRRHFATSQAKAVESYYEGQWGWRPRQIGRLLEVFQVWARLGREDDKPRLDKFVKDAFGDGAGLEARLKELEGLLDDQIAAVEAAFAEEMQAQERKDAIARDACLAPEGKTWEMLLRLEMALDRSIDRKVRILLTMRKDHAQQRRGGSRTAPTPEVDDSAEVAPNFSSASADLKVSATQTESPHEENDGETSKSPEQSENVVENKGPAAEGVAA